MVKAIPGQDGHQPQSPSLRDDFIEVPYRIIDPLTRVESGPVVKREQSSDGSSTSASYSVTPESEAFRINFERAAYEKRIAEARARLDVLVNSDSHTRKKHKAEISRLSRLFSDPVSGWIIRSDDL